MENRNQKINIRVSGKEKEALMRSARRAGLSLSEYLRKAGLGQTIQPMPDKALRDCYRAVGELIQIFIQSRNRATVQRLNYIQQKLLEIYHRKESDSGGNH